jgi:HD superfamily phosphohydrolase YqeK
VRTEKAAACACGQFDVVLAVPGAGSQTLAKDATQTLQERSNAMGNVIAGITVPDSKLAREATELVRDTESELLFHHSTRVFLFGALTGERKKLKYDPELLYIGGMFHDMGLTDRYRSSQNRFEVDSANAAAEFLRQHGIGEQDVEMVWDAISLHTTPGIPPFKKPVVQLVTAGVEMDVLGFAYDEFTEEQRRQVVAAHPRASNFKEQIIDAFNEGMKYRPDSTFGTVNDDVLALKDPSFRRLNFCSIILGNAWVDDRHGNHFCNDPSHKHP